MVGGGKGRGLFYRRACFAKASQAEGAEGAEEWRFPEMGFWGRESDKGSRWKDCTLAWDCKCKCIVMTDIIYSNLRSLGGVGVLEDSK